MKQLKKALKSYIKENLKKEKSFHFPSFWKIKNIIFTDAEEIEEEYDETYYAEEVARKKESSDIDSFINNYNDYSNFQTLLFEFIDNKGLKDSDVYNKVHIDRRLFSKIRSDKNYHPSKETIILLGLALELNEYEIEKLLDSASYSLPKNNHFDLIIRFCFINKIYKVVDVNDLLDEYKCKLLNY